MTSATVIDGKACALRLRADLAVRARDLADAHGLRPTLAAVLVGEDPASQIYVRNKGRAAEAAGLGSVTHNLPDTTKAAELLDLVHGLNRDPDIHGILVQMPLPGHIEPWAVIDAIDPAKDVDGFHAMNVGRLVTGSAAGFIPCTAAGCLILLHEVLDDLSGLDAVVLGRSNIVGKPVASLLLSQNCTVTMAHSRTRDLAGHVLRADIVIAAVGRPGLVKGDWIKPGATVIDVGINRVEGAGGKTRLAGDVDFKAAAKVAGAITPVPGGVGPMTIACLLQNTFDACCRQKGIKVPD